MGGLAAALFKICCDCCCERGCRDRRTHLSTRSLLVLNVITLLEAMECKILGNRRVTSRRRLVLVYVGNVGKHETRRAPNESVEDFTLRTNRTDAEPWIVLSAASRWCFEIHPKEYGQRIGSSMFHFFLKGPQNIFTVSASVHLWA